MLVPRVQEQIVDFWSGPQNTPWNRLPLPDTMSEIVDMTQSALASIQERIGEEIIEVSSPSRDGRNDRDCGYHSAGTGAEPHRGGN